MGTDDHLLAPLRAAVKKTSGALLNKNFISHNNLKKTIFINILSVEDIRIKPYYDSTQSITIMN